MGEPEIRAHQIRGVDVGRFQAGEALESRNQRIRWPLRTSGRVLIRSRLVLTAHAVLEEGGLRRVWNGLEGQRTAIHLMGAAALRIAARSDRDARKSIGQHASAL